MTHCSCATTAPSVDEALAVLMAAAPRLETTEAPLGDALGRILARTIDAPRAYPPFNRAMMDGYAARHADLGRGNPRCPAILQLRPATAPDRRAPAPLPQGHCAPIATGAPLPPGADVVLRRERVQVTADRLRATVPIHRWADCETVGTISIPGAPVLAAGARLDPGQLSLAARHGFATLPVHHAPRVAVLVTGDELVPPGEPCGPGSIHDSNGILLQTTLARFGAEVIGPAAPLPDHLPTLETAVCRALASADVVCVIGGSSVGNRDFGRTLLRRLGDPLFEGVSMRPGRPTSAARTSEGKLLLALPGRPAALLTALHVLVRPLLASMQGHKSVVPTRQARLAEAIAPVSTARYLPVCLESRDATWWARTQDIAAEQADALAVIPADHALDTDGAVDLIPLH